MRHLESIYKSLGSKERGTIILVTHTILLGLELRVDHVIQAVLPDINGFEKAEAAISAWRDRADRATNGRKGIHWTLVGEEDGWFAPEVVRVMRHQGEGGFPRWVFDIAGAYMKAEKQKRDIVQQPAANNAGPDEAQLPFPGMAMNDRLNMVGRVLEEWGVSNNLELRLGVRVLGGEEYIVLSRFPNAEIVWTSYDPKEHLMTIPSQMQEFCGALAGEIGIQEWLIVSI